jgi:hypothetical protein
MQLSPQERFGGSMVWYSATSVGEIVRASAYSTTSSSFVAQSRTPSEGRSCGFFTSRSSDST